MTMQYGDGRLGHEAICYGQDDHVLSNHVAGYIAEGIARNQRIVVIATEAHTSMFVAELHLAQIDTARAVGDGSLAFFDAEAMLQNIVVGDRVDARRFRSFIGDRLEEAARLGECRAYGEMVGLLWSAGRAETAKALEDAWNDLRKSVPFDLLCAYPADLLDDDLSSIEVDGVLCTHDSLRAANPEFFGARWEAIDAILGDDAAEIRRMVRADRPSHWGEVPEAEATMLWLRKNMPGRAAEIGRFVREHFAEAENTETAC